MPYEPNNKIVGAFLLGFALVAGAYTLRNFGEPRTPQTATVVEAVEAPTRVAIEVTDSDANGIEDWKDAFVTTEPIQIDKKKTTYEPPTTLTGELGVSFMERILSARTQGPFGKDKNQIIESTVDSLAEQTAAKLYNTRDATILEQWQDTDIRNYANAMGGAILNIDITVTENELEILDEAINRARPERLKELAVLAGGYKTLRDQSLATPVPAIFLKEHLDIINTYEALYQDITAMTLSQEDPAVALLRIKRYEDDVRGLSIALENMYKSIEPYARLFTNNDAAAVFASFSSNNNQVR
jgi:hypothetical protein